jgi:hypothetical protein
MAANRLLDGPRGDEAVSIRADLALMGRIRQKVRAAWERRCRVLIPRPTGTASAIPPDGVPGSDPHPSE